MQPSYDNHNSTGFTDASLAAIGETCKGLTSIDMSGNENITDVGIASLTQGCREIKAISVTSYHLTDASYAAIGETCKGLTHIDMSGNKNITDVGIASLTQGCSQLKTVIRYSSQLTDASLAAIGETYKGLTSINMSCTRNMTDDGIASLTQGCSQLQSFDIPVSLPMHH